MTEELLPCPCCGAKAILHHDTSSDYEHHWDWGVYCPSCGLGLECRYMKADAITDWNRRLHERI